MLKQYSPYYYGAAVVGFFGLFGLLMVWHTVWFPAPASRIALLLLMSVTPLLLPLRGFLQGKRKSNIWMAYLSLFYFINGIMVAYSTPLERLAGSLEIIFSLLLFLGCAAYVRFSPSTVA
jgi:uncharacterized membrane protein